MNIESIEKEINRIRNLPQYKKKTDDELRHIAEANLSKKQLDVSSLFEDKDDQAIATELYGKYITVFPDFDYSELGILRDLVYEEVYKIKIQKKINENMDKGSNPFDKLTSQLHEVEDHIIELKRILGIMKQDTKEAHDLTALEILQKRFEKYINEHKSEFETDCKHCGKMLLLRRRTKDFVSLKHPWFAGRFYFNYEIIKDVKEGKLSKEDAWRYLYSLSLGKDYKELKDVCFDYIEYCIKHWEEIIAFVKNPKEETND